jgi:flagellar biogenesis protein FliO
MLEGIDERIAIVVVGLGLTLGLLLIARMSRPRGVGPQKLIHLGSGHRLHVVEVEGRRLLVGTGPSGPPQLLTELAELPPWAHAELGEGVARGS